MVRESNILIIILINIFLLVFSTFNFFRRKNIINFLIVTSIWSLVVLEIAKFSLFFDLAFTEKILGLGICILPLSWLITSLSLYPSKEYHSLIRVVLSPLCAIVTLIFFLIWWIKPFITIGTLYAQEIISGIGKSFFALLVFDLSLALSNLERSYYFLRQKTIKFLFLSGLFLLLPYIYLGAYAVAFSVINMSILFYSSVSIFLGGIFFMISSQEELSFDRVKEETAVNASLVFFLIGGYLFLVGVFIKLFQILGWNLQNLFSFLTTLFIFFAFLLVIFSTKFKERLKSFLIRYFTYQRYDWQKIWEDFTYKISLITNIDELKKNIEEAISKIFAISKVTVCVFDEGCVFEEKFCDWLLRYGNAFSVKEIFSDVTLADKFPLANKFFKENSIDLATPLYGEKKIIGIIGLSLEEGVFVDRELLKVLSLQASGVILSCQANKNLRDSEKRESIYRISSFVIHDVKNYINTLSLMIANKDKFDREDFRQDAIFTLENTVKKMQYMVEEFASLRGEINLNFGYYNIGALIDEAISDIGKERFNGIFINKDIDDKLSLYVDRHYINRVLINLLINAIEAMNGKGEIYINSHIVDNYAVISIRDTGCGISKDFIENKLFKPFTSTKQRGMGIGLYQCKIILERHRGYIEVESKEGEGTTFKLKLPL
ncbi:MAG: ATP-binding protein [Candidatus Omnitrophica bacterium]|nr:ATP-binding protein [Candidatus Omnitrophota bacterium]MCM8826819.1 ATP-binding protein [Candidatus Omnitrophota bacterium]